MRSKADEMASLI